MGRKWISPHNKTVKYLDKSMGRPKKVVESVEAEEVVGKSLFQVFDSKGDFVREYSVDISGEKSEEYANELAKELNGFVK